MCNTTMAANEPKVRRKRATGATLLVTDPQPGNLLGDIRHLILDARQGVAQAVNAGLTLLYWQVGRRIRQDIL